MTEDETEEIFETNSFIPKDDTAINVDDLTEMTVKIAIRSTKLWQKQ